VVSTENNNQENVHKTRKKQENPEIWQLQMCIKKKNPCNLLRSIVNQSSTMTNNIMTNNTMNTMTDNIMTDNTMTTMTNNTMTDNTIKEMPTYDRAIHNMKSRTTDIL